MKCRNCLFFLSALAFVGGRQAVDKRQRNRIPALTRPSSDFVRAVGLASRVCSQLPRRAVRWGKPPITRFEFGTSPARSARPDWACRLALGLDCSSSRSRALSVTFVALDQSARGHEGRSDGPGPSRTASGCCRAGIAGRRPRGLTRDCKPA